MADKENVIRGLKALEQSMQTNQCYACSHEFGDTILSEAIDLLEQTNIVRCEECRQNGECSIQFKFAYPDNPGEWFCAYGKREET